MTDLQTTIESGTGDLVLAGGDLATDPTLSTACFISLFSDGRAPIDEPSLLSPDASDLRGWWGARLLPADADDNFGSLLWLLERQKITQEVINRAREVTEDALEWLVEDGIAEEVAATVSRLDFDRLLIQVEIVRGTATEFSEVWDGILDARFETGPGRVKLLFR